MLAAEHADDELTGGGQVSECDPGGGGGDVPHYFSSVDIDNLKLITLLFLWPVSPLHMRTVHSEGGECLIEDITHQQDTFQFWNYRETQLVIKCIHECFQ